MCGRSRTGRCRWEPRTTGSAREAPNHRKPTRKTNNNKKSSSNNNTKSQRSTGSTWCENRNAENNVRLHGGGRYQKGEGYLVCLRCRFLFLLYRAAAGGSARAVEHRIVAPRHRPAVGEDQYSPRSAAALRRRPWRGSPSHVGLGAPLLRRWGAVRCCWPRRWGRHGHAGAARRKVAAEAAAGEWRCTCMMISFIHSVIFFRWKQLMCLQIQNSP